MLELRRTEGAPVDFISSLVKAGVNITHSAPSEAPRNAFMKQISVRRDAQRALVVERSTQPAPFCTGFYESTISGVLCACRSTLQKRERKKKNSCRKSHFICGEDNLGSHCKKKIHGCCWIIFFV